MNLAQQEILDAFRAIISNVIPVAAEAVVTHKATKDIFARVTAAKLHQFVSGHTGYSFLHFFEICHGISSSHNSPRDEAAPYRMLDLLLPELLPDLEPPLEPPEPPAPPEPPDPPELPADVFAVPAEAAVAPLFP